MTVMRKFRLGVFVLISIVGVAHAAINVALDDFASGTAAGAVFTLGNLEGTPIFAGGALGDTTVTGTVEGASGTIEITWGASDKAGPENPSTWTFGAPADLYSYGIGLGIISSGETLSLRQYGPGEAFLLTFNTNNLGLDPGTDLVFSLRSQSGKSFDIYQRTGSGSGQWVAAVAGSGDYSPHVQVAPLVVENGMLEFAIDVKSYGLMLDLRIDTTSPVPMDTDPPTPSPATWTSPPTATSPFAIMMTATAGSDESDVEYYFISDAGNPSGGTDSGWQSSPSYIDNGLHPSNTYSYSVYMRDTVGNTSDVSIVSSAITPPAALGRTNGPPNVVFIYADDLGYADIGHNASVGSLVYTPNIDRICNEGIYLSNYLTHHVCTPSRAGLMTGRHYTRVGSGMFVNGTLDNSVPNIAKDFQAAGYATGCFGKWHSSEPNFPTNDKGQYFSIGDVTYNELHRIDTAPLDNGLFDKVWTSYPWGEGVNAYGFDRFVGFFSGSVDYFDKYLTYYRDVNWWHDGDYVPDEPGYLTDLLSQHSLEFIENNRDIPFFCYVPHGAVHAPYDIMRSDLEEMCTIWDDEYPALAWDNVKILQSPSTTNLIGGVEELRCSGAEEFDMNVLDGQLPGFFDLVYYTMIYSMDKATGLLLDRLEVLGLTTNTIVVFASDNGGVINRGDNSPFRGGKVTIWEGGIHVPAAIWWPGTLDANKEPYSSGDNVYSNLTQYFDWYPTLIDMTEQTLNGTDLDGINLTSNLFSRISARPSFENCYFGMDDYWASVHNDRWKLHFNRVSGRRSTLLLYDLLNDPAESSDIASSNPIERDTLIALMDQWFASGDVTASYMPLSGDSLPPYANPAPFGDILEIKATQTGPISGEAEGVSVGFSNNDFKSLNIFDLYVQASDVIEYDIYVAEDSGHDSGFFCSPSRGSEPLFNTDLGIHPSGSMLYETVMPRGQWVRIAVGVGDIAPSTSNPQYIGLFNPAPGYSHFYLDNVVVRRKDGTVRDMVWNNGNDSDTSPGYYYNGTKYSSLPAGCPFSNITLATQDLSVLGSIPDNGLNYSDWMAEVGDLDQLDPAAAGPTNQWSLMTEYGLGSDPSTYTAGMIKGTNAPTAQQLGSYAIGDDYLTLSFDFNRDAGDVEVVVSESTNLVDWTDTLVLQPPYADTASLATNLMVLSVSDNAPATGYPVPTTRITARGGRALADESAGFLKLVVRPVVAAAATPLSLNAVSHEGILLEWAGGEAQALFVIERAPAGTGSFTKIAETGNYQYTDSTAVSGQSYDYRVRAINAAGLSSWSNIANTTR